MSTPTYLDYALSYDPLRSPILPNGQLDPSHPMLKPISSLIDHISKSVTRNSQSEGALQVRWRNVFASVFEFQEWVGNGESVEVNIPTSLKDLGVRDGLGYRQTSVSTGVRPTAVTGSCHWTMGIGADHWDTPLIRCFRLMLGLGVMGRGDRWGDRN